ncbi:MAG: hypothetical protein CSA47_00380 [Gammaproteobacteria bacterium]|nr:MAG: hypothetical protein CSA47_00380 [Gammaproteobacteria bacterium]
MKDNNPIEDILKSLPQAAKQLKQEADNIGRTLLDKQLKKADIVTREEFEEQRAVLKAALEKLQRLEQLINEMTEKQTSDEH